MCPDTLKIQIFCWHCVLYETDTDRIHFHFFISTSKHLEYTLYYKQKCEGLFKNLPGAFKKWHFLLRLQLIPAEIIICCTCTKYLKTSTFTMAVKPPIDSHLIHKLSKSVTLPRINWYEPSAQPLLLLIYEHILISRFWKSWFHKLGVLFPFSYNNTPFTYIYSGRFL